MRGVFVGGEFVRASLLGGELVSTGWRVCQGGELTGIRLDTNL